MQSAHPRRWTALAVIALAQFMVIMDTSIIGVALPEIQTDLGFSPEDLSWVFNAYVVAFGGLLLLGGRLSDLFGAKRIFTAGWTILAAGSLAAGLAETTERGDRRARGARRRRRADRAVGADAADDALRRQPEGAHQGVRDLRRRRTGGRHRRRLPRRRDHGVDLVAVGVLREHPDRAARARRHARPDARRRGTPRLDRHRRRPHRHRRPRPSPCSASSAHRRKAGAPPRRCWPSPAASSCSGSSSPSRRSQARAADAPEHPPHAQPRRGEPGATAARGGLDPDVVLPEPLPPAGARVRRVRGRRGTVADDRRDHGPDGRSSPRA